MWLSHRPLLSEEPRIWAQADDVMRRDCIRHIIGSNMAFLLVNALVATLIRSLDNYKIVPPGRIEVPRYRRTSPDCAEAKSPGRQLQ